jgi:hypothetical protein
MAKSKRYTYKVIPARGPDMLHTLDKKASLAQLQAWVGGYIQMIKLQPNQWVVVNEEGAINGMPVNPAMTWQGGPLHGPIVLLPEGCRC